MILKWTTTLGKFTKYERHLGHIQLGCSQSESINECMTTPVKAAGDGWSMRAPHESTEEDEWLKRTI